jgi:dTDP-4-dehydrorhamnose 3,5-epimerase
VTGPAAAIPGVTFGRIDRLGDPRGSFREVWRRSGLEEPFVQANVSTSAQGVLRGLHVHRRQLDHWVVLSGRAYVAVVDIRPVLEDRAARPVVVTRELGADETVTIPAGVAHGFLALEPLELLYLVTAEYDGTDEHGFAWDDPAVGVRWPAAATPDGRPILSSRDRSNPTLDELVAQLGA